MICTATEDHLGSLITCKSSERTIVTAQYVNRLSCVKAPNTCSEIGRTCHEDITISVSIESWVTGGRVFVLYDE